MGDWKVIGKLKYNVKMRVGAGRRGVVFVGAFENRQVAIKRIDKRIDAAKVENEIDILLKVDSHSNIVRYFAQESDGEFDYIALDLCLCSLYDLICPALQSSISTEQFVGRRVPSQAELAKHGILEPIAAHNHPMNDGLNLHFHRRHFVHDSVKQMCLDCIVGLIALHQASGGCIIHRDIKPQNILIADSQCRSRTRFECKLADMGMAKIMNLNRMSFDSIECGTLFWNAPELLLRQSGHRLTKQVDVFSLGCVISFFLSKGRHPYGEHLVDQHKNMRAHCPNLQYCKNTVPEAFDLLTFMLCIRPTDRISASECAQHPFFWNDARTLGFLMDISDFIEKCHKTQELRVRLELATNIILGDDWSHFVDADLLSDAGKHRKYNAKSLRDYLRLMRNKWNHFAEMDMDLRCKLGQPMDGRKSAKHFLRYFLHFSPFLVMHCYKLIATSTHIVSFKGYYAQISPQRIQKYSEQVRVHSFRRWMPKC